MLERGVALDGGALGVVFQDDDHALLDRHHRL